MAGLGASQAHCVGAVDGGGGGAVVARGWGAGVDGGGGGGGVGAGQEVGDVRAGDKGTGEVGGKGGRGGIEGIAGMGGWEERSTPGAAVCDLHPPHTAPTAAPGLDLSVTCTSHTNVTPVTPGDRLQVCGANMEFAGLTETQRKRILDNREEALRRQKICRQQQSQAATSLTSSLQPRAVTPSHATLQPPSLHTSINVRAGAASVAGGGGGWGAGGAGGEEGGGRGEVKCSAVKPLTAAVKSLAGGVTKVPVPKCPTHARECRIKRVHKQGANKGRLFFSCIVPSCQFFQWGDVWFPKCSSHPQRPSVLRFAQRERESARARARVREFIRIDTP